MIRTYTEMIQRPSFEDRFEYCKLPGEVGQDTFGFDRYLNQAFYSSDAWKRVRREVILRDNDGDNCLDLGVYDRPIRGMVFVHHLNPLTKDDVLEHRDWIIDPNYLICVSGETHRAIHYGTGAPAETCVVTRSRNDTCPWRR